MYFINMEIVYSVELLVLFYLLVKTFHHQIKKRHHKVELAFFHMLVVACVMLITFFTHAGWMLFTGKC